MIEIKESTFDDVKSIQALWADEDVMKYIWPGGLIETEEAGEQKRLLRSLFNVRMPGGYQ